MELDVKLDFVRDLRAFADYIEKHGDNLPLDSYDCDITVRCFLYDITEYDYETGKTTLIKSTLDQMKEAAKALGGKIDKVWSDTYLDLRKEFGKSVRLEISANRERVCRKVVIGTEEIPEKTHVTPARTKEIVEWVCDDALLKD